MHVRNRTTKQKGETIVEVLIAVAVIASALGGAFAISNRSRNTVQSNQERYQAQLYANEQADLLHAYLGADATRRAALPANFCIVNSGGVLSRTSNTSETSVGAACNKSSLYKVNVTRKSAANTSFEVYTITVVWDSILLSSGQERVELVYGT